VLRISPQGKQRRIYVKRRDLLRSNGLLPRDLRRIDPTLSVTKTSPAISIKEHVLLVNLGGVRCARFVVEAPSFTHPWRTASMASQGHACLRGSRNAWGRTGLLPTLSDTLTSI